MLPKCTALSCLNIHGRLLAFTGVPTGSIRMSAPVGMGSFLDAWVSDKHLSCSIIIGPETFNLKKENY